MCWPVPGQGYDVNKWLVEKGPIDSACVRPDDGLVGLRKLTVVLYADDMELL